SMWEKPTPNTMNIPSNAAMKMGTARAAVSSTSPCAASWRLVDNVVMVCSHGPPPEGRLRVSLITGRSTGFAGHNQPFRLPGAKAPVACAEGWLAAYSCGGSRGFGLIALTHVPVLRPAFRAGTDDSGNYSDRSATCKRDQLSGSFR